jgi:hypothetical protein
MRVNAPGGVRMGWFPFLYFTPDRAREWDGYHLEFLGLLLHYALDGLTIPVRHAEAQGAPVLRLRDSATSTDLVTVQLRLQRAMYAAAPRVVAELHWWPALGTAGVQPHYRIDPSYTAQDEQAARRGHALLHQMRLADLRAKGGRPEGSSKKYPTAEAYREGIRRHIYDVPDRARKLKDAPPWRVAKWLDISESLMYRRNGDYDIDLAAIRERRI